MPGQNRIKSVPVDVSQDVGKLYLLDVETLSCFFNDAAFQHFVNTGMYPDVGGRHALCRDDMVMVLDAKILIQKTWDFLLHPGYQVQFYYKLMHGNKIVWWKSYFAVWPASSFTPENDLFKTQPSYATILKRAHDILNLIFTTVKEQ